LPVRLVAGLRQPPGPPGGRPPRRPRRRRPDPRLRRDLRPDRAQDRGHHALREPARAAVRRVERHGPPGPGARPEGRAARRGRRLGGAVLVDEDDLTDRVTGQERRRPVLEPAPIAAILASEYDIEPAAVAPETSGHDAVTR